MEPWAECAAGLGEYPTLGCARRLEPERPAKRGFWDPWRASCAVVALLTLMVCGGGAAWLVHAKRRAELERRAEQRAWLEARLGAPVSVIAQDARQLHERLAPAAERAATAADLADFPRLRAAARGVVVRPDGVLLEVESYMAVVVLARRAEELAPEVRARLEAKDIEHIAAFEEVEAGVHVRTFSR